MKIKPVLLNIVRQAHFKVYRNLIWKIAVAETFLFEHIQKDRASNEYFCILPCK